MPTPPDQQSSLPPSEHCPACKGIGSHVTACHHGLDPNECDECVEGSAWLTCRACGGTGRALPDPVVLRSDWRREGMVVVADSMTGKLLGCMGIQTWERVLREETDPCAVRAADGTVIA